MGLMHITGTRDGPPVKVGCAVTDLTTGLYAANGVMAALLGRAKSGVGEHLDVCLSDCQVATLSNMAGSVLVTGERDSGRWGTAHRKFSKPIGAYGASNGKYAHFGTIASVVPYRSFKTSNGHFLVGAANDRLFGLFCAGLGKPEWATDKRFATNPDRVAHRDILEPWIEVVTKMKTTEEWLDIFEGTGMPYAKVNDLLDTVTHEHGNSNPNHLQKVEGLTMNKFLHET